MSDFDAEDDFNDDFGDDDGNMGGDDDGFGGDANDDDFGADDADAEMMPATTHSSGPEQKEVEFRVLSVPDLEREMKALVKNVASVLDVPEDIASMLLRNERWNREVVVAKFFEDREKTLRDNGLMLKAGVAPALLPSKEPLNCPICDDPTPKQSSYGMECNHIFCRGCWSDYLEDKIKQGKPSIRTSCPMYKCLLVVPDSVIAQLVNAEINAKYQHTVLRSFVEDNRTMRWCPAARCDKAVKVNVGSVKTVTCSCGMKFCFQCNEEAHEPVSCNHLQLWLEKCRNESETAHWIIANTKKCPKCAVRIEKNQGCNHMTCRSCKFEFCWVCMGSWEDHGNHTGGFYRCNKYDPKGLKAKKEPAAAASTTGKATSAASTSGRASSSKADKEKDKEREAKEVDSEEAKAELDRYLHYYTRYHNHDQSKHFAAKQQQLTEKRMQDLQSKSPTSAWIDVQFLKAAMDQVFECRRVLKYTYVFGYYLPPGPEKELFEFLQQELERNTEQLSELSEKPLDKLDRTEVVNNTRITAKFLHNLLDGVANGLTNH